MKTYKTKPRRRYVPNVRPSQLPKPPKVEAYEGCNPATAIDTAIGKIEYCAKILTGLAQNGEIGGSSTISHMQEALRWMRGARAGLNASPPAAQFPNPADYGKLD